MLSHEELIAIKLLGLPSEVEETIISSAEKHREVLFTRGDRTSQRHAGLVAADAAAVENQIEDKISTASGAPRLLENKAEPVPWHVQFTE